jgi:lysine-N-methylase
MSLPVLTLPIVEHWDCHRCGNCCRGTVIPLNEDDLRKLREQKWEEHPDFQGVRTVVRHGLLRKTHQLAQRSDGSCVFLAPDGQCRIHQQHGPQAKPLVCRMFPLQVVAMEDTAWLTLRRSCPSAAADLGRPVEVNRDDVRALLRENPAGAAPAPPPVIRGARRNWQDFQQVATVFERFLRDERYPLVRRIAHGVQFCQLLEQCRLRTLDSKQLAQLVPVLESAATQEAGDWFSQRSSPGKAAETLFRQTAAEYARLHPRFAAQPGWLARSRIALAGLSFASGRGAVPRLIPSFSATTYSALDRPLGKLGDDVWRPLYAYFAAAASSKQYALLGHRHWSLVESFRALAMSYAVALWLLRWASCDRPATAHDMIEIVTALDRGQGFAPLVGFQHRQRIATLQWLRAIGPLTAWYGR